MEKRAEALQSSVLFRELELSELKTLARHAHTRDFRDGDAICKEGEPADSIFIVMRGRAKILKKGAGGVAQPVAEIPAGEHFGEMAFFDRVARTATAAAVGDVSIIEIPYGDIERLGRAHPDVGLRVYAAIARTLCRRMRETTGQLSSHKELGKLLSIELL